MAAHRQLQRRGTAALPQGCPATHPDTGGLILPSPQAPAGAGAGQHLTWHTFKTGHPALCRGVGLQQCADPLLSESEKQEFNSPALPPTAAAQQRSSLEPESCVHLLQTPTRKVRIQQICAGMCCAVPRSIPGNTGSEGLSHLPTSDGSGTCMQIQPWKALLQFPTYFQTLAGNTVIKKK